MRVGQPYVCESCGTTQVSASSRPVSRFCSHSCYVTAYREGRIQFEDRVSADWFTPFLKGRNISQLAAKSGLSRRCLTRIKFSRQHYVYLDTADKLSTALGLHLDIVGEAA